MKKSILVFAILTAIAVNTNATIRTVSNDPVGGAQYATLVAAYTAATTNDTLLIEGTNIVHATPSPWAKQLVVMGIGFNPTKTSYRLSQISGITCNSSGNGSRFYGISFTASCNVNSIINNYTFSNCNFSGTFSINGFVGSSNLSFINCMFSSGSNNFDGPGGASNYSNILFTSCVFNGWIEGNSNTTGTLTVDHCLFLNSSLCISSIRNSVISNSIFMNTTTPVNTNSGNLTLTNNLSRLNTVFPPTSTYSANTATGNITNSSTFNFVTYTPGNLYSIAHNYHLPAASPAIGAGTGGSDIGPHGSLTNFNETGEVLTLPIVRTLNINNTTVVTNGILNVQINASKPNDN